MSGPARTAEVTVTATYRITDAATEGEMIDSVLKALRDLGFEARHENSQFKLTGITSSVKTISTGGHI